MGKSRDGRKLPSTAAAVNLNKNEQDNWNFRFQILKIFLFVSHLLGFCGLFENLLFFVGEAVEAVVVNFFQNVVNVVLQILLFGHFFCQIPVCTFILNLRRHFSEIT